MQSKVVGCTIFASVKKVRVVLKKSVHFPTYLTKPRNRVILYTTVTDGSTGDITMGNPSGGGGGGNIRAPGGAAGARTIAGTRGIGATVVRGF